MRLQLQVGYRVSNKIQEQDGYGTGMGPHKSLGQHENVCITGGVSHRLMDLDYASTKTPILYHSKSLARV